MKTYLFLADGFEEIEALSVVDIFRRAGLELETVTISSSGEVAGAHGIRVAADIFLKDVDWGEANMLVFPGGMPGAQNLASSAQLMEKMQAHYDKGGYIGAICAAPALVLSQLKTDGRMDMTCYPGFEKYMKNANPMEDGVVLDGHIVTAKGPGFAEDFALTLVAQLAGSDKAEEVAAGLLI